ncbi:putative reverse transcriptase domain-containing protein [Tanacetum coccineum]
MPYSMTRSFIRSFCIHLVMAILVISISSDSSEDSVGTLAGRVILFETPIIAPTIPPYPDYAPASPDYLPASDSESDLSKDPSSDHIPPLPAISLFLSSVIHQIHHHHLPMDHSSSDLPSTSAGLSRKRCRSPMASVPALPPVSRALSPVHADLIPSPKRIRSPEIATDLKGCSEDSFEPYAPREVGLGVDVKDESSEQSRSRGTDIEVNDDVKRSDRMDIDPVEAVIKACFDFADIIRASGVDVRVEAKMPNTRFGASMTHEEVEEMVTHRVAEEMEARNERNRNEGNGGNRNGGNGGNGNGGNGENRNHGMNYGGFMPVARESTFQDFLKCKLHNFLGTEGIVGLTRWFEKMKIVFNISNCPPKYQVKYATCKLQDSALTWWNSHKRTIGVDAAYALKWAGLMKLMTEVYCLRNEIQKMETELWNLTVKGNDLTAYTQRFQELILLCTRMVSDEEDRVERQNVSGKNVARAYADGNNEKRGSVAAVPNTQRAPLGNQQGVICYECGRPGHVKRECPKLRNQNYGNRVRNKTGNQTRGNEATTKAYAIGGGGTNPDSNVVISTFLLNNCYASMLFDSGTDRSFVSSTFSALLDVAPSTLDTSYAVELADGRISETNVVLRGCTLGY